MIKELHELDVVNGLKESLMKNESQWGMHGHILEKENALMISKVINAF